MNRRKRKKEDVSRRAKGGGGSASALRAEKEVARVVKVDSAVAAQQRTPAHAASASGAAGSTSKPIGCLLVAHPSWHL